MLNGRFWTKVDKSTPNGCWEWTANKNNKGYGMFSIDSYVGKKLAHRLSYEAAKGRIPKGGLVLHSCDNPGCVNPDHLRVGSHKQNIADMDSRGRRVPPHLKGETNPHSFLTDEAVVAIRRDYLSGAKNDALADSYGLSRNSVQDITLGRSWKHLLGVNGAPTLEQLKAAASFNKKSGAKVTQAIADEIRRRLTGGELGRDLAAEFGIHKATISDIKLRKIWAD